MLFGHSHVTVIRQGGLPAHFRPVRKRGWLLLEAAAAAAKGLNVGFRRGSVTATSAPSTVYTFDEDVAFGGEGVNMHLDLPEGVAYEGAFEPDAEYPEPLVLFHQHADKLLPGGGRRPPPLHPDAFAVELAKREFSRSGDDKVVLALWEKAWVHLSGAAQLGFAGLGWGAAEGELLGAALPHFRNLWFLALGRNLLGDKGVARVADGVRGAVWLEAIDLAETGCGDIGAIAVMDAVPTLSKLRTLSLAHNTLSGKVKERLREGWAAAGKRPDALTL